MTMLFQKPSLLLVNHSCLLLIHETVSVGLGSRIGKCLIAQTPPLSDLSLGLAAMLCNPKSPTLRRHLFEAFFFGEPCKESFAPGSVCLNIIMALLLKTP